MQAALRTPRPKPKTHGARPFLRHLRRLARVPQPAYMLLALATGILYFMFAVTGSSMSIGLAVLIIGVPFFLLFIGTARVLALAEGRIVESMLGTRMPRRPRASRARQRSGPSASSTCSRIRAPGARCSTSS